MSEFHFQEEESVLLVGEGNFSFCYSIIDRMRSSEANNFTNLFATCLEEEENSIISSEIKQSLLKEGVKLLFAVDARKLSNHPILGSILFNKILFNFPHVGGKMKIHLNRQLLQDFFLASSSILDCGGEIIVTLCAGQGGTPADKMKRIWADSWQIVEMAARAGLILTKTRPFPHEFLSSYVSVGYRGKTKSFNTKDAIIHFFRVAPPLLMNVEDIVNKNMTLHSIGGVLMSYTHKNKMTCNPYLSPASPQSYIVTILEDICRKFDRNYKVISEAPLFTKVSVYSDQAYCIVSDEKCYLRKNLLYIDPNRDGDKHCIIKGLSFNKLTGDFAIPPAECHAAVFGPLCTEIFSAFIGKIKNLFHPYLCIDDKTNVLSLEANNWFELKDDMRNGIDINIDQVLANIFGISWRQLWCPGIRIQLENCYPLLIPPSLYFQSFTFDITFRSNIGLLDITELLVTVQQINCDLTESVTLISEYHPEKGTPTYSFRFGYKSYYLALCRKTAVAYHNLIGKAIEQLLHVEIV